ncbi:MAG TPA: c-type cytochrome biogenesis protein CcsB [Syntrophorhabdus sp.]|jgi:cytochrome c-type biogenesis protein CcsB|nr:c-type cytochrome biogenesis protein CcsB [Syntrophorhabdus sp.]HOH26560.1 c-type cytochrome biogenesis protein CcsB [Syntrophorhabdus sp.]HQG24834.1 c-type cytochrome biogenesis protein CcsB [Syntrophorhabdus sp.]HQI95255.1 c-type cytochrome biogenesis protein CcsB [Syntrophorhabdus sp.]HQO63568.1 c-type cytochrome biogenesis protein CcsB [Syntrophorhabdus sp.]
MAFHHKILGIVTLLYLCLFFIHLIFFAFKKEKIVAIMWPLLYGTLGLHTVGLILRWLESYRHGMGHAPLSNFYESLVFYAWCVSLIVVFMKKRLNYPAITVCATVISLFLMGYASISPSVDRNIQPLVPALQSNWLHIHVLTCFLAYASFAVSFISGFLYMFTWKNVIPPRDILDEINYRSVVVGFPMLSAGIFTGAVWAHYAWGSYWSWDPKETWSLITWIVYAVFLHARLMRGWKGKKIAILSIVGFASVIFTYFGVNFILSGLHSYAT